MKWFIRRNIWLVVGLAVSALYILIPASRVDLLAYGGPVPAGVEWGNQPLGATFTISFYYHN
jgi:hypothetical protein